MTTMIKIVTGVSLTLVTDHAIGAEAGSLQHEIEQFLASGAGNIVLIILTLLLLLWLLLPLAVFGLKTRLNNLIQVNNNLIRESKEATRILTDIRDELVDLKKEETTIVYTNQPRGASDEDTSGIQKLENHDAYRESGETNKILTEIRNILAALSEEEAPEGSPERPERTGADEAKLDLYNEIKFDP